MSEFECRRAGLLGGGVSKARLEMAEGEGVFLTAGPKFRVQGGTMTLEAQTNMAHKSHLHLGLRLGKPPQLQHQSAHGKLPGKCSPPAKDSCSEAQYNWNALMAVGQEVQ